MASKRHEVQATRSQASAEAGSGDHRMRAGIEHTCRAFGTCRRVSGATHGYAWIVRQSRIHQQTAAEVTGWLGRRVADVDLGTRLAAGATQRVDEGGCLGRRDRGVLATAGTATAIGGDLLAVGGSLALKRVIDGGTGAGRAAGFVEGESVAA